MMALREQIGLHISVNMGVEIGVNRGVNLNKHGSKHECNVFLNIWKHMCKQPFLNEGVSVVNIVVLMGVNIYVNMTKDICLTWVLT